MALQTVFMAGETFLTYRPIKLLQLMITGLTLIYCTWISPEEIFNSATSNDINACSIVLFVITERWPAAKKYRDIFEAIKQNVIDPLADGRNQVPRQKISHLKSIIPSDIPSVEYEDRQEFTHIMTDMSGHSVIPIMGQNFGGSTTIDMEQVQYQSGDLLGFSEPNQRLEQYRSFDNGTSNDQDAVDALNQWSKSRTNFSTDFASFEWDSFE